MITGMFFNRPTILYPYKYILKTIADTIIVSIILLYHFYLQQIQRVHVL